MRLIMNNQPIGIFDSGIGGITVLKKIIEILPNEEYIYYADTKNAPYGIKPKDEVKRHIQESIKFLISQKVKAIVVACNTATSIAIKDIRKKCKIPIVGIEPAAKTAVERRKNKKILIMATPITIREEKLNDLLKSLSAQNSTDLIAMPKLVEFAENREFESDKVKQYIKKELKEYNIDDYSELVLGCTHFLFFKKALSDIFPDSVEIIDGSIGVAKRLKNILQEQDLLGNNILNIKYYYSGERAENEEELNELLISYK